MNKLIKSMLAVSAIVVALELSQVMAQTTGGGTNRRNRTAQQPGGGANQGNRGNFDPAQMQQRMMDRYKEVLEITSDEEWKALSPLVEKVSNARRETMASGGSRRGSEGGGRGGPAPELGGALGALKKALDAKASSAEIKAKIAAVADERQAKETVLVQTQEALRQVLSVRQEGLAILNGLLPPKKP